jgi:carboxymethylenebutenolidase
MPRVRAVQETRTIPTPDGDMGIHVVRPEGDGPFPVVLFFHHGPGLDDGSKEAMQLLADRGWYVVTHDRYHRESPWYLLTPDMRSDQDAMKRFFGVLMGTTEEKVDVDVQAVLTHLEGDPAARPGGMACIGYCIGARSVVCTMAAHPDRFVAGVGMHPSFCTTDAPDSPHLRVPSITGSLYVAFGSADKMQSPDDNVPFIEAVRSMSGGRGDADIHDGADHGFAVPRSPAYHEAAATASYAKTFALFERALA